MAVDLGGIKTAFKSICDTANTTTAAYDLSTGLATRVQKVLKVNPARIMPQASFFPWVTITTDKKGIEHAGMARDQITAKRDGEITFSVVGAVWEQNVTDATVDDADEEIEQLMENVEEVLRRNFRLNNTVLWTKAEETTYHSLQLDEQTHMRVGVLNLKAKVNY